MVHANNLNACVWAISEFQDPMHVRGMKDAFSLSWVGWQKSAKLYNYVVVYIFIRINTNVYKQRMIYQIRNNGCMISMRCVRNMSNPVNLLGCCNWIFNKYIHLVLGKLLSPVYQAKGDLKIAEKCWSTTDWLKPAMTKFNKTHIPARRTIDYFKTSSI